jgi:hypothetical protein
MHSFSTAGANSASALATLRLIESFLRLPTITATSRGLSMRIPSDVSEGLLESTSANKLTERFRSGAGLGYPI